MNLKVNKSQLKNFPNLVSCGAYDLQHLLMPNTRVCYVTRSEGWACDVFSFDKFSIATGYDTPKFAIQLPHDLTVEIEDEASKIPWFNLTPEERKAAQQPLLDKIWQFLLETK